MSSGSFFWARFPGRKQGLLFFWGGFERICLKFDVPQLFASIPIQAASWHFLPFAFLLSLTNKKGRRAPAVDAAATDSPLCHGARFGGPVRPGRGEQLPSGAPPLSFLIAIFFFFPFPPFFIFVENLNNSYQIIFRI